MTAAIVALALTTLAYATIRIAHDRHCPCMWARVTHEPRRMGGS